MSISVVVLAKNEEKNLEACLKTLKWADELIVIDDNSTDNTAKIAKKLGANVYQHYLNEDFAAQRNFGLEKAGSDWVFFVDADEQVSPTLRAEIINTINNLPDSNLEPQSAINGFLLKREDKMWNHLFKYGETANVKLLRLGKKGRGEWHGLVHEVWDIRGKVNELKNPLTHQPHPTISEFLKEINFYSTLRAKELKEEGKKTNLLEIIFYPKAKFVQNYFFKLGILDGMPGFIMALLMSFHSFLVRSKLYLLWKQGR